jgi:thiol-disulfide isomerase/thioredoxin
LKFRYRTIALILLIAIIGSLSLALTGCSANDSLANQYRAGDNKNYIAGDGTVTEFAKENRGAAVAWSGTTVTGDTISSKDLAGVVVVMNFWFAACAPCRAEAPDLVALQNENKDVQFIGVNVRDSAVTANAFERNFNINWPSIIDANSGSVILAFTGIVTPQAVPTTLVIGKDGKVTARVLGRIDKSILGTLIKTAVKE